MDDDFAMDGGFDIDDFTHDISVDFDDDALTLPEDDLFESAE